MLLSARMLRFHLSFLGRALAYINTTVFLYMGSNFNISIGGQISTEGQFPTGRAGLWQAKVDKIGYFVILLIHLVILLIHLVILLIHLVILLIHLVILLIQLLILLIHLLISLIHLVILIIRGISNINK